MRKYYHFLVAGILQLSFFSAFAQPANDECSSAIALTVNSGTVCTSTTAGTIAGATASSQANSCFGTDDDDVWFSFVATATAHKIELLNVTGSTTDLYHVVYGGTCGALGSSLVCSDPNNSVVSGLTIGNTYYIRVYSWTSTTGQTTSFNVCVSNLPPPPANDECSTATALTVNTGSCVITTAGTISSATASSQSNSCSGTDDDDVWFSFVATATAHKIELLNVTGSTSDLYHVVYGGTCGALGSSLVCSDPNNSVVSGLTIGNTYYIRVYSWTSTTGQTTSFNVCVSTIPPPPANDACSGAIPITVSTSTTSCTNTTVNTFGATTESYNSSFWSSSYDDGVWYSFVAGASGARITGSNFSPSGTIGWSVFNGSCGSLIEIAQNGLNSNAPIWGLTVGQTYYICAFYNGTGTTGTFDMCVVNTTALGEEEIDANGFSLYPNPTTGTFTLNSAENLNNATVTVFDIKGQVVYSVVNSVSNKVEIDLSANTNGIYYVQISNNDNVITKKIVKQ